MSVSRSYRIRCSARSRKWHFSKFSPVSSVPFLARADISQLIRLSFGQTRFGRPRRRGGVALYLAAKPPLDRARKRSRPRPGHDRSAKNIGEQTARLCPSRQQIRVMVSLRDNFVCSVGGARALPWHPQQEQNRSPPIFTRKLAARSGGKRPPPILFLLPPTRSRRRAGVHARTLRRTPERKERP